MNKYYKRGIQLLLIIFIFISLMPFIMGKKYGDCADTSEGCSHWNSFWDKKSFSNYCTLTTRGATRVEYECEGTWNNWECTPKNKYPPDSCKLCDERTTDKCCVEGRGVGGEACYNYDLDCGVYRKQDCTQNRCLYDGSRTYEVCEGGCYLGTYKICSSDNPYCKASTHRCVECTTNSHCTSKKCVNNVCEPVYEEEERSTTTCTPGKCKDGCHRYTSTTCKYEKDFTCGGGFCPCCKSTGSCNVCCGCTASACPSECGTGGGDGGDGGDGEPGCDYSPACSPTSESRSCGTCNTGTQTRTRSTACDGGCTSWSSWGSCQGDYCTYSPSCSPTSELRCNDGNVEIRTRSTNCCGGCSDWSGWSVYDNCKAKDAWCRNNACVDCDTDSSICSQCGGTWLVGPYNAGFNNLACCRNVNTGATNEWVKYHEKQWGGTACCDSNTDCAIANKDCVNNLDSDYNIARMEDDTICVEGNLMSRTKLVSLQLLTIAKNKGSENYVLFCDKKEYALNYIQKAGTEIADVNNVCVLSLKGSNGADQQIMIGTSLNPGSNMLGLVNLAEVCNYAISNNPGDNAFHQCTYNNIFYNPAANAVIFSSKEITNVDEPVWTVALTEYLTDLINNLLGTSFGQDNDFNYLTGKSERYTEIYVNRIGDKAIRALKEPRIKDSNAIEVVISNYQGFSTDLCGDKGCLAEGEAIPSLSLNPDARELMATECCQGLTAIAYPKNFDEDCNIRKLVGSPAGVCSKCGNNICEAWENECNCAADCKTTTGGGNRGTSKEQRRTSASNIHDSMGTVSAFNCTTTSMNNHTIFIENRSFSDKWLDLTAKLRPR